MKTLDEVIKNLKDGTEHLSAMLISKETWSDALQWLEGYRGHIELDKLRDKCEGGNPMLTFDELKTMSEKPVWIEVEDGSRWGIVSYVYKDMFGNDKIAFSVADSGKLRLNEKDYGESWKAYRKEK